MPQHPVPGGTLPASRNELAPRIAGWIANPAEHAIGAEAIRGLGDRAIPGIRAYLERGPQAVPQMRCFAVAMLARLDADAATTALCAVLRHHPLRALEPPYTDSEYVVKCDALDALCMRTYPGLADDIALGVAERLHPAVAAAGRLHLLGLADALIDVLDDDVLADAAVTALAIFGARTQEAAAPRLDAWLIEAGDNARKRLALLRLLRALHHTGTARLAPATLKRALDASHPALRAAAALLVWPARHDDAIVRALLHGALGFDRDLADDCREALAVAVPEPRQLLAQALQRNAEPDLYGEIHPLSSERHDWLARRLRRAGPP